MKLRKKILTLGLICITAISLVACGSNQSTDETATKTKEEASDNIIENEDFIFTVIKEKKVNAAAESHPLSVSIDLVRIMKAEAKNTHGEELLADKEATILMVNLRTESKSDDNLMIFPDQATLNLLSGEQVDPILGLGDLMFGPFYGKAYKEGKVYYKINTNPDEINHIKVTVDAPYVEETGNDAGEEVSVETDI